MSKTILLPIALCAFNFSFAQEWPLNNYRSSTGCELPYREYPCEEKTIVNDVAKINETKQIIQNDVVETITVVTGEINLENPMPVEENPYLFVNGDILSVEGQQVSANKNDESDVTKGEAVFEVLTSDIVQNPLIPEFMNDYIESVIQREAILDELTNKIDVSGEVLTQDIDNTIIIDAEIVTIDVEEPFICKMILQNEEEITMLPLINHQSEAIEPAFELQETIELTVFPNPTTDVISIKFNGTKQVQELNILDMNGKIALSKHLSSDEQNIRLSLGDFQNGTYFLQVNDGMNTYTKQLVVIH